MKDVSNKNFNGLLKFEIKKNLIEIKDYHDWWICEKLLLRKRIVFRVIGSKKVGMGHIYRALTLAHEIIDHEIIFITTEFDDLAIKKLLDYTYRVEICSDEDMISTILNLKPDLLINDLLNTNQNYVSELKRNKIKVMNFEDIGPGAILADITINELYDKPVIKSDNILWGHKYCFLRDEFKNASRNRFKTKSF